MMRLRSRCDADWARQGQSTLEYALVLTAFLAMIVVLGAMATAFRDGLLLRQAQQAASHTSVQERGFGAVQDALAF